MGKSIQPKLKQVSPKKGVARKNIKSIKKSEGISSIRKKPDIIESYLRTLSNNFGSNNTTSTNNKRKQDEEDEEEMPITKKFKSMEDNESCTEENSQIYNVVDNIQFQHLTTHLKSDDEVKDLFHIDDAKSSNEHTYYVDWLHDLCDEISLEGLDGITIEALWSRMKTSSSHPTLLEGKEEIFWNLLKYIDDLEFYILEHPRGKLIIYDKNNYVCPDTGIVLEPMIDSGEIYPFSIVHKDVVRGSCATYDTRMENSAVIRKLGLKEALNIYGNRLVIVGSQKMREHSIISKISDPKTELGDTEYCLLERVGRSRGFGEFTQGKVSVLNIIKDSRSLFHVRKSLEGKKLLKNQYFILRNASSGQNKTGKLLHLPRFYKLQKSKTLLLIEEIVELLRQKPGFSLEFGEFKKYFPRSTGANKIMKTAEFNKYIKTDIFRPYRYLYPNATVSEWKYKNRNKEKVLRIFQLIDPTINVAATWNNPDIEDNIKDEQVEDGGIGSKTINADFLKEVFWFIFKTGKYGITLQELVKKINLDYYTIRIVLRKLQAKNMIDSLRTEHGKQRHIYYFARCLHSGKIPTPLKKTTQISENVLKKLYRDKKTNKIKSNFPIIINSETLRYSSQNYPFNCPALRQNVRSLEIIASDPIKDLKAWSFPHKGIIKLPDICLIPKFCSIVHQQKQKVWHFIDVKNIITSFRSFDLTVKLILVESVITGVKPDLNNMLGDDLNENNFMQDFTIDFEAVSRVKQDFSANYFTSRDFLLGPNPIIVSHDKTPEGVEVTITQSTQPETYMNNYSSYVTFDKNITSLSLSRTNMILEEINKNLIISDIYKVQRTITEKEMESSNEGWHGKMDKNTLHRILVKLVNEGYIKIFKYLMMSPDKFKTQWFITHPTIEYTHPLLTSNQEQLAVKFFLGMDRRHLTANSEKSKPKPAVSSPFDSEEAASSMQTLKEISCTKPTITYKQNRLFGRILGYQPKFVRMQLFHELLYYLIYDYQPLDQMSHGDINEIYQYYDPNELREIPPIYQKTIDWKMFIPPLPIHKNFTNGWTLLCDVILSIPLSLWVKIFHISLECPKLFAYLEHPIRQHYLIRDIPLEFRYVLMYKRKYLFNAVELIYRLCFIGLVQLGPQCSVVKDQIFLYLNRKAKLLDTSSSGPSYHKITPKNYEELWFNFLSSSEVENYWCQLWTISMNTPLGQRRVMDGKSVTIETSTYKSMLLDSLKSKTPDEVIADDNGQIPGDKRGAAGLDSSMWSHIKRNWLWSSKLPKSKGETHDEKENEGIRNANIACIKPVAIKYKELINQSRKVFMTTDHNCPTYIQSGSNIKYRKKPKVIHRSIMIKKLTRTRKDELDAKDKMIVKKVGKTFRAKFNQNEDKILYICKAANYFLTKNKNILKVSRFLIRDILHILCPESQDKTSGACSRRLIKLERSDISMKRLRDRAYELISLKDLSTHFAPIIFNLNKSSLTSTYSSFTNMDKSVVFLHAVWYIYHNFKLVEKILQGQSKNNDYFSPNNIDTFKSLLVNIDNKKSVFNSPSNQVDIEKEAIKSVLMSALNCSKLGQNISYQFYQICKKYSDKSIRSAIGASKGYQTISVNKKSRVTGNNIRAIPFQLSITYTHMQKSTFSCLTLHTIYQHFVEITEGTPRFAQVDTTKSIFTYSRLLARNEIASVWPGIHITLNVPGSAHVLSPYVKNQNALITSLAEQYQRYLKEKLQEINNPLKKTKRVTNKMSKIVLQPSTDSRRFVVMKTNTKRLLSTLPCFCNDKISKNIPLFLECNDEDQINKYLQIFLEALTTISLNLFSSEEGGCKLLQSYITRYSRPKVISSFTRELEAKVFKMGHIVREFLKSHYLMDFIHCFENKVLEKNEKCEELIRVWLEKSKMTTSASHNNEEIKPSSDEKKRQSFFKYNMATMENPFKMITNVDEIPKVDEIAQGMMESSSNFRRNIPHISDVVHLLSQEKCSDVEDEKLLEELRQNFITEYPTLEKFEFENLAEFKQFPKYLFHEEEKLNLENIIHRYCHVKESDTIEMLAKIKTHGGTGEDHLLAGEIIGYVFNQKVMGATGVQIEKTFSKKKRTLDLHVIVEILCDTFILLEVGITEKTFVHIEHSDPWLVDTFHLSPQENQLLHASENNELQMIQEKIESRIHSTKPVKVIMMPWLHLDGTLNYPLLDKWLTIMLSYCLESPGCSLPNVFEKFYLVKPVELYLLLKILQELKCLKILVIEDRPEDLWSDIVQFGNRTATILDDFEKMFVDVEPLAAISLGYYLDKEVVEFA